MKRHGLGRSCQGIKRRQEAGYKKRMDKWVDQCLEANRRREEREEGKFEVISERYHELTTCEGYDPEIAEKIAREEYEEKHRQPQ